MSARSRRLRTTRGRLLGGTLVLFAGSAGAEAIRVAAAADLKYAMDEIVAEFEKENAGERVEVIYGSSGQLNTQIQQGAPYDLFFSADIAFARELFERGFASSEVRPHALGRIVLWSASRDATEMTLESLREPAITRIAIANPRHAPYGQRAEEALRATGVWAAVEPKLVYGENIAHAAQFVDSGNAQVGVIALSLALSPELSRRGGHWLIPESLHQPLEQGYVVTRRARDSALARRFAAFVGEPRARAILTRYGFVLPEVAAGE